MQVANGGGKRKIFGLGYICHMKLAKVFIIIFLFSFTHSAIADVVNSNPIRMYLSLGFKIGYCLSTKGLYIGPELDIGIFRSQKDNKPDINTGINLGKTWTWVNNANEKQIHRQGYMGLMVESESFDFKMGYTKISKVKEGSIGGLYFDLSYTQQSYKFPWFGINAILYETDSWQWLNKPYISVYTKYKYDFRASGLKKI